MYSNKTSPQRYEIIDSVDEDHDEWGLEEDEWGLNEESP